MLPLASASAATTVCLAGGVYGEPSAPVSSTRWLGFEAGATSSCLELTSCRRFVELEPLKEESLFCVWKFDSSSDWILRP